MLQLSLTLANDLYDMLAISGEPVEFLAAAQKLLALKEAPVHVCREIMDALVDADDRFCWHSPQRLGLRDWEATDPDLKDVNFVVVDVETTGARPGPAKITEIGIARIEGLRVVSTYHSLVNPQRPIPAKIIEITGITPDMVRDAPRIEQLMPHILDFIRGAVLVGHNAQFDLGFLNYELGRLNGRRMGEGAFDTLKLSRLLAPGLPNHRLATVARALGSQVEDFHRALPDALATAHVFLALVGRLQERGIIRLNQARAFADPLQRCDRHKLALTSHLPRSPGAYLFRDERGEILYVGKADRLRDRVRSYFISGPDHSRRVRQALRRLHSVDFVATATPLEAVVREQDLITQHRPPCNTVGQNPEKYVYLKAAGARGLRLFVSASPSTRGAKLIMGPFRGKSRVVAAIELLEHCYPLRRCTRQAGGACLYGQTGRCSKPCTGDRLLVAQHDELVHALLRWLAADPGPWNQPYDPPELAAQRLAGKLAQQRRFEEAAEVRVSLGHALALRRLCGAIRDALQTNVATLWPSRDPSGTAMVDVALVWNGQLTHTLTVTEGTAALALGRLSRSLEVADAPSFPIALPRTQLDPLLAVRRWLVENPEVISVPFQPQPHETPLIALQGWSEQLLAATLRLLRPAVAGRAAGT